MHLTAAVQRCVAALSKRPGATVRLLVDAIHKVLMVPSLQPLLQDDLKVPRQSPQSIDRNL